MQRRGEWIELRERCSFCRNTYYESSFERHQHLAKFFAWGDNLGRDEDDALHVCALNHEYAAEEAAKKDDHESGEYDIARGGEFFIFVRDLSTGTTKKFAVEGEWEPSYSAWERDFDEGENEDQAQVDSGDYGARMGLEEADDA